MNPVHKLSIVATITIGLIFSFVAGILGLVLWFSGASGAPGIMLGLFFAAGIVLLQWYFSPSIIKRIYKLQPVRKDSKIYKMVKELSKKSGLKTPQVWITKNPGPNAFAFGRSQSNANVCVTTGLLDTLNEKEVRAVISHELGHVKHRDMIIMTIASIIPLLMYFIAITFQPRGRRESGYGILIFIGAMLARMIGHLMVLWLSRVREYGADAFSAYHTSPKDMMSALAKIGYGTSRFKTTKADKGLSTFYIADPSARKDFSKIADLIGMNKKDFEKAVKKEQKHSFMEVFRTHPLMYKRIISLKKLDFSS